MLYLAFLEFLKTKFGCKISQNGSKTKKKNNSGFRFLLNIQSKRFDNVAHQYFPPQRSTHK
jgi:hypothetical protein